MGENPKEIMKNRRYRAARPPSFWLFCPKKRGFALWGSGNRAPTTRLSRREGWGSRRGQSLVVWAIAEGRACAKAVDEYLMDYTNLL